MEQSKALTAGFFNRSQSLESERVSFQQSNNLVVPRFFSQRQRRELILVLRSAAQRIAR